MAEYINRKAAISRIKQYCMDAIDGGRCSLDAVDDGIDLVNGIKALPAADVVPVVHGRWVIRFDGPYKRRKCYCSHCGKNNGVGGIAQNQEKPYCPNCGAKMDGGESNASD